VNRVHDKKAGVSCGFLLKVVETGGKLTAAQGEDAVGSAHAPKHAGMLEALTDDGAACGFQHAGADEMTGDSECAVALQVGVFAEAPELFLEFPGWANKGKTTATRFLTRTRRNPLTAPFFAYKAK
jgi:hypothetical protein